MSIQIDRFDHIVLTVQDVATTCEFYQRVLGMSVVTFGNDRKALHFGQQKINLHPAVNNPVGLVARQPQVGSIDLCLISSTPIDEVVAHLHACGVAIEAGPMERTGAVGAILSVYFRDPDGNLIEVSNYLQE